MVRAPVFMLGEVHAVCDEIEGEIQAVFPGTSVQIHLEPPGSVDR